MQGGRSMQGRRSLSMSGSGKRAQGAAPAATHRLARTLPRPLSPCTFPLLSHPYPLFLASRQLLWPDPKHCSLNVSQRSRFGEDVDVDDTAFLQNNSGFSRHTVNSELTSFEHGCHRNSEYSESEGGHGGGFGRDYGGGYEARYKAGYGGGYEGDGGGHERGYGGGLDGGGDVQM